MSTFKGRDVLRILTRTKRGAEITTLGVYSGDELPDNCSARRRETGGSWSWWLARAVLAVQAGAIKEIYAYQDDHAHQIVEVITRSASRKSRVNEMAADLTAGQWWPGFFPAYLLGLIAAGVAAAAEAGELEGMDRSLPPDPADLMDALRALRREPGTDAVARASDELALYLEELLEPHLDQVVVTAPVAPPFALRRRGSNLIPSALMVGGWESPAMTPSTPADAPEPEELPVPDEFSTGEPASWAAPWVRVPADLAFKGTAVYAELTAAIEDAIPTLLVGPTGSGKNTLVAEALTRRNLLSYSIKGAYGLQDLDILGAVVPTETKNGSAPAYRWVDGPLVAAWRHAQREKVSVFFDEITRCRRKQLNVLIGALNPTPALMLPPGAELPPSGLSRHFYLLTIPTTAEMIVCPVENLVFLAAGNLGGQYAVEALDPALESRFTCQIELGYLAEDDEVALVVERTGLPAPLARKLVVVAAETRRLWQNAELANALDPRGLLAWATRFRRAVRATGDREMIRVAVATARLTWLASVAGRDHRGMLHDGRVAGLEDFIETICTDTSRAYRGNGGGS